MEGVFMNEKYLLRLQKDLRLKNFTRNTSDDYYRFTKRFLDFTSKEAMAITMDSALPQLGPGDWPDYCPLRGEADTAFVKKDDGGRSAGTV